MKYNKYITTLEILKQYPFGSYHMGINNLTLECINEALKVNHGFTIDTLDADYIQIYDNCTIILVNLNENVKMYVFFIKEDVSEEVIKARREIFFKGLNFIN